VLSQDSGNQKKDRTHSKQHQSQHNPDPEKKYLLFIFRLGRGDSHHIVKHPHCFKQELHFDTIN